MKKEMDEMKKRFLRKKNRNKIYFKVVLFLFVIFTLRNFNYRVSAEETKKMNKYYTSVMVMQGDTVRDIANKYISSEYKSVDQYVDEVRQMNYLNYDCKIHTGEYIVIPYYSDK